MDRQAASGEKKQQFLRVLSWLLFFCDHLSSLAREDEGRPLPLPAIQHLSENLSSLASVSITGEVTVGKVLKEAGDPSSESSPELQF